MPDPKANFFHSCQYIRGHKKEEASFTLPANYIQSFSQTCDPVPVISQFLALIERMQACVLNCRNMNKCIQAAIVRLNKAKAFCCIKPFNCAGVHVNPFHNNIDSCV